MFKPKFNMLIICLIFLMVFSFKARSDYLVNQDTLIVGKELWLFHQKESCRQDLKVYSSKSNSDPLEFIVDKKIKIEDLESTPFNFTAGKWYKVQINDGSNTRAYIIYNDLNSDHGSMKNLYYFDSKNDVDLLLLKNACVSNIDPSNRDALFDAENKEKLEKQRIADERDRVERESKTVDPYQSTTENLKKLSESEFCENYGMILKGKDIPGFGKNGELNKYFVTETNRRNLKIAASSILESEIKIGMTECEMIASWGQPIKTNRTVGSFGVHKQHIYGKSSQYVYTENGKVTGWQD